MKTNSCLFLCCVFAGVLLGISSGYGSEPTSTVMTTGFAVTDTTVTVGQLHSSTGALALSETGQIEAERLAFKQINEMGGILGRKIEYIFEDGKSDWAVFAKGAEKLVTRDKVAAIFGCFASASRKAVLPVIEKNNHLLFYPTLYEGLEASPNVVYSGQTSNQQVFPAIEWLMREKGAKTFYMIGSHYVWPITSAKLAKKHIEKLGGKVLPGIDEHPEPYLKGFPGDFLPLGHRKFQQYAKYIREQKPDVVLSFVVGVSNVAFFKQLNDAGVTSDKQILISFVVTESEFLGIGGKNFEGFYSSMKYFQSINHPNNKHFIKAYKEAVGEDAVIGDIAESAYLAPWIWKAAVEKAKSFDVDKIRAALPGITINNSPDGSILEVHRNQHIFFKTLIGRAKADGQFDIVYQTPNLIEPNPFPDGKQAALEMLQGFDDTTHHDKN